MTKQTSPIIDLSQSCLASLKATRLNLTFWKISNMISEVSTQLSWPSLSLQTRNLKLLKESLAIGVFIDLKKAIDSIKNSILLDKMNFYGVRGTSLSWFQDDLNSRCQFLELANCRSSLQTIKCGFPQSSLLGSFLFLCIFYPIFLHPLCWCHHPLSSA